MLVLMMLFFFVERDSRLMKKESRVAAFKEVARLL
jgi:hypothetical protein